MTRQGKTQARTPLHAATLLSRQAREARDVVRVSTLLVQQMDRGNPDAAWLAAELLSGPFGVQLRVA